METYQANENEINGVNLDNYLPYQQNFDTILYVHKSVLEREKAKIESKERAKKAKADKKKKTKINNSNSNYNESENKTVLEQTVRFAKHLAPIVIPPDKGSNTPVFYTVETCSKCKRKDREDRKSKEVENDNTHRKKLCKEVENDNTYRKKQCKKIVETYRKERRKEDRNISVTESLTHSSQSNTLDDININQSLTCTMSEQSDKREKYIKNEVNSKKKRKDKIIISESFEAVATELTDAEDARIKVQLMNNADKNAFCDSIRSPLLDAVRECISEYSNEEVKEEVKIVKRLVKCNTDKLDKILDRLENIEKHLQKITKVNSKSPRQVKTSTLELLGEDIDERSCDEEYEEKRPHEDNRVENMGCGEVINMKPSTSVGVKTDRPNRIPARFCWTDADKA